MAKTGFVLEIPGVRVHVTGAARVLLKKYFDEEYRDGVPERLARFLESAPELCRIGLAYAFGHLQMRGDAKGMFCTEAGPEDAADSQTVWIQSTAWRKRNSALIIKDVRISTFTELGHKMKGNRNLRAAYREFLKNEGEGVAQIPWAPLLYAARRGIYCAAGKQ